MDLSRILGTVLEGALQPPRRATRRRTTTIPGLGRSRSGTAQLTRALAGLATAAAEALASRPAPAPAPRPSRPVPDLPAPAPVPAPRPAPGARGSVPASGPSPWAPKSAPPAPPPEAETAEALLMIRAMIAAARGDGRIDAEERQVIAGQLDGAGLGAAERDFVLADFDNPLTPEALAKEARDPMQAAQLYAAAFAAAGEVSAEERAWLDRLGRALRLDRVALAAIEQRLGG
jgi:tellurite resistance protein